ncbi:MAG TPA: hypothetical protein VFP80_06875 [Thermoanaerobaculia bacterium]|nr:hypothetical protein [Thermoanaerobaculia bacterium]
MRRLAVAALHTWIFLPIPGGYGNPADPDRRFTRKHPVSGGDEHTPRQIKENLMAGIGIIAVALMLFVAVTKDEESGSSKVE